MEEMHNHPKEGEGGHHHRQREWTTAPSPNKRERGESTTTQNEEAEKAPPTQRRRREEGTTTKRRSGTHHHPQGGDGKCFPPPEGNVMKLLKHLNATHIAFLLWYCRGPLLMIGADLWVVLRNEFYTQLNYTQLKFHATTYPSVSNMKAEEGTFCTTLEKRGEIDASMLAVSLWLYASRPRGGGHLPWPAQATGWRPFVWRHLISALYHLFTVGSMPLKEHRMLTPEPVHYQLNRQCVFLQTEKKRVGEAESPSPGELGHTAPTREGDNHQLKFSLRLKPSS